MKTGLTRVAALAGAVALSLGTAGCGDSAPAPTPAAPSASASPSVAPSPPAPTPSAPTDTPSTTASPTPAESTSSSGAGDSPEVAVLLKKAQTNALEAKSAELRGTVKQGSGTLKIAFKGTREGKPTDIAIDSSTMGKARVIAVPEGSFIQADAKFWKKVGAPAALQKAGKKFVKSPGAASSLSKSFGLSTLTTKAFGSIRASQLSSDVGEETVNGVDCWVLTDRRGKEGGALYISKKNTEIVRFTGTTRSPAQLDFSKWNEKLDVKAPSANQIFKVG